MTQNISHTKIVLGVGGIGLDEVTLYRGGFSTTLKNEKSII